MILFIIQEILWNLNWIDCPTFLPSTFKMFSTLIYVYLFIMKIRFPKSRPISTTIKNRYGPNTLNIFRRYEKINLKTQKSILDMEFLTRCQIYDIMPKFLFFKLYNKNLHNSNMYKQMQRKLLINDSPVKML